MADKPNILVIMGDDGWWNVSAYNHGSMGYRTPNIDRIGREGTMFTDWYGQQSCTAGRAAFLTGQSPIRTGLTKVGLPGAKEGLTDLDPTIADLLKPHGYVCGQFGKNHVGDRNEHPPSASRTSAIASGHAASCTPGPPTRTMRRSTRTTGVSASRRSTTPVR
jgi:arylsulfatase A-like enzyme